MTKKCSISADEKIWQIADAQAERLKMSRSEFVQHLIIYAGLVGGEYPLTTQILSAPTTKKEAFLNEALRRSQDNDPIKAQSFWKAVETHAQNATPEAAQQVSSSLLKDLLNS